MGNVFAFVGALTMLKLGHVVVEIVARVLYERARRATVVAVLKHAREDVGQLLIHHDPVNCDIQINNTAHHPDHLVGS